MNDWIDKIFGHSAVVQGGLALMIAGWLGYQVRALPGRITAWLDRQMRPVGANPPRTQFSIDEIATEVLQIPVQDSKRQLRRIAEAMREAGMDRVPRAQGAARLWERRRPSVSTTAVVSWGRPRSCHQLSIGPAN